MVRSKQQTEALAATAAADTWALLGHGTLEADNGRDDFGSASGSFRGWLGFIAGRFWSTDGLSFVRTLRGKLESLYMGAKSLGRLSLETG